MSKTRPATDDAGSESPSFPAAHRPAGPGIILIDRHEKISSITPEAEKILGLPSSVPPGSSISALPAPLQTLAQQILASGEAISEREIELKRGDAGKMIIAVGGAPLQQDKKMSGVVLALSDAGHPHELRERLWRLDRLANVGTLAAGMAHEIKNALVAGKTFIDLLLEKNRDAELAEVVRRELGRIDAMVTRILKFAGPGRP
jgi:two-component system sensor histidine kinase AtoS